MTSIAPDIIIRRCTIDDASLLALVGGATFLDGFFHFTPAHDIAAHVTRHHSEVAYKNYLDAADNAAWMAVHKRTDAPVGYQLCTSPDLPIEVGAYDWELKRIYLLGRFQGSGLAKQFVEKAVAEGEARGKHRMLLGVNEDNSRAIGFYRKPGFEIIGERNFSVGSQSYRDVIMALDL